MSWSEILSRQIDCKTDKFEKYYYTSKTQYLQGYCRQAKKTEDQHTKKTKWTRNSVGRNSERPKDEE